uniref:Uncharacterized protein n=1 Tax=Arundo donax TaxID=35708 RepID=A0A0A9GAP6_ARUDO
MYCLPVRCTFSVLFPAGASPSYEHNKEDSSIWDANFHIRISFKMVPDATRSPLTESPHILIEYKRHFSGDFARVTNTRLLRSHSATELSLRPIASSPSTSRKRASSTQ